MASHFEVTIHRVKEMLEQGNITLADIRDPQSFQNAHIAQAVNIQDDNLEKFLNEADKAKPLICYCYHGIGSQQATQFFKTKGFREVYSMIGGFEEWRSVYPSISSNPKA